MSNLIEGSKEATFQLNFLPFLTLTFFWNGHLIRILVFEMHDLGVTLGNDLGGNLWSDLGGNLESDFEDKDCRCCPVCSHSFHISVVEDWSLANNPSTGYT